MADTVTANLGLTLQEKGNNDNTWGDKANTNFSYLEDAITENKAVSTTGGTTNLTTAESRSIYLDVSGTLVSNAVINASDAKHVFIVKNDTTGAYTVTIQPSGGSGVEVTQGRQALVYLDGAGGAEKIFESLGAIGTSVQAQGDVLDDLNSLGASTADGEFLVATGAGALAWESGSTARTSLGLGDVATYSVGTSGATVPLLNGANTWSEDQTINGVIARDSGTITWRPNGAASATGQATLNTSGTMTVKTLTVTG